MSWIRHATWRSMLRRLAALAVIGILPLCASRQAAAQDDGTLRVKQDDLYPLTFSRLIVRIKGDREIAIAPDGYRVRFLEALRRRGYPALGAESLVFGQDRSDDARFVLGGTITRLECGRLPDAIRSCEATTRWELMDRDSSSVVYRVDTRHVEPVAAPEKLGELLVWGTFRSLLKRPAFVAAITKHGDESAAPAFSPSKLRTCTTGAQPMPKSSNAVLDATVVVRAGQRLGSGTFISPDGYVLTAAHVLATSDGVEVQLHGGQRAKAEVVRVNRKADVALLRLVDRDPRPCLPARKEALHVGDEIYAVGSPLGSELAFSVSRGIVSGVPTVGGTELVQTDASINHGNSGGPLVDGNGRFIGVVSAKATGSSVEGIAFGIPADRALQSVGIELADATDPSLAEATASVAASTVAAVVDKADARVLGQHREAPASDLDYMRTAGGDDKPKKKSSAMPIVGVSMVIGGTLTAAYFTAKNQEGESPFGVPESLGWGAGVIGLIILAAPSADDDDQPASVSRTPAPRVTASFGLTSASVQGSF